MTSEPSDDEISALTPPPQKRSRPLTTSFYLMCAGALFLAALLALSY